MIRVIKVGGRAQGDPALPVAIRHAVARGERVCLVHGGGDEVSALQRSLGQEPRFVNGRRATSPEELAVVRMVLSGTVNKRLVAALRRAGVSAAGISGEDGGLLGCREFGDGSLGAVGEPSRVDPGILRALLAAGFVPVVSPLGFLVADDTGCNVNGDDAAAAVAAALGAGELLLVSDVAGVLDADGRVIPALDATGAAALVASGVATGGMIAKLEAARRTTDQGVARVRVGGIEAITDLDAGTTLGTVTPAAAR